MMIKQSGPKNTARKLPLDLERYQEFEIPQEYMAFEIHFENINQEEGDNLEADYLTQGYKIFHTNLERANAGLFNFKIIVAKAGHTF